MSLEMPWKTAKLSFFRCEKPCVQSGQGQDRPWFAVAGYCHRVVGSGAECIGRVAGIGLDTLVLIAE